MTSPARFDPFDTYLDNCIELDEESEADGDGGWPELGACEGCPIGGGLDCNGVWRWRSTDAQVTQAEREANP